MVKCYQSTRQVCVETSQVLWCYSTQSCWTRRRSYATVKCRSFLKMCAMCSITKPIIFINRTYLVHGIRLEILVIKSDNLWPRLWVWGFVLFENEIWILMTQISTADSNKCGWKILTYLWRSMFHWIYKVLHCPNRMPSQSLKHSLSWLIVDLNKLMHAVPLPDAK